MTRAHRLGATIGIALLTATALTACIGQSVRSTEDWLADQPHVVSIGVPDSTVDELSYTATIRAELDPKATDAQIEKLIDDALDYVASQPGDDVTLQFGVHDVDFEVATKDGARTALALWHQVVDIPNIVGAFVSPDAVSATTLRATGFAVFDALEPLGVLRSIDASHAATDFEANATDFKPPLRLTATPDCVPSDGALILAQAAMTDDRVDFGTLDLCQGLDVTFGHDYQIADAAVQLRGQLDAAGLSAFPVSVSVAPQTAGSADFHIVAVTPGDAAALAVVAALEGSGVAMRYELSADRSLDVESSSSAPSTAAQLFATFSGSPGAASLGTVTLVGSDTTVTGAVADLPGLLPAG